MPKEKRLIKIKVPVKKRLLWIDLARFVAIIAVIIGHLYNIVFTDRTIPGYTAYSVTLFIILAGYTSALSWTSSQKILQFDFKYLLSRLSKILIPYFIATLIYHLYSFNFEFMLPKFFEQLVFFKIRPPFYFVFIYIQLLVVAYFIVKSIVRKNLLFQIVALFFVYHFSIILTSRTSMLGTLYGGGEYLLGGTYLFAFALGVFLFDRLKFIKRRLLPVVCLITLLLFAYFQIEEMYRSTFSNPPNNALLFYTLLILMLIYVVGSYIEKSKIATVLRPLAFLGKYSLYIYLYHVLAIEITTEVLIKRGLISQSIEKPFYFFFALLFPIFIVKTYELLILLGRSKIIQQLTNELDFHWIQKEVSLLTSISIKYILKR